MKRKKFENGWNQYCFDFKYCNRWTCIALLAGSFFIEDVSDLTPAHIYESKRQKGSFYTKFISTFYQIYRLLVENQVGKDSTIVNIIFLIQLASNQLVVDLFNVNAVSRSVLIRSGIGLVWV